jgi:putative hydrolase of the HAD superfamily
MSHPNGNLSNLPIRAVFFDLDGTLRHDSPASNQVFFDHAVELGAPDLPASRIQALRWAHAYWANVDGMIERDYTQYEGDTPQFWRNYACRYLLAYGLPEDQAVALAPQMRAYMAGHYTPENTIPGDAHPTLKSLQDEGYVLGVITNRSRPVHEEVATLGLTHYFDLILAAGEVNTYKPEPGIFEHALDQLGVSPQESLYIGDNYYADILGAKRAGMHPILLDPDRVFPDADCPVIAALSDIPSLLKHEG